MDIPDRIRTARRAKGLSAKAFAMEVGVSPTAVAKWERGVHTPKRDMLQRIATVLDLGSSTMDEWLTPTKPEKTEESVAQILDEANRKIASKLGVPMIMVRVIVEIST